MSETEKKIDYRALPAGSWSPQILSGAPVGFFVTRLLQRAGVPEDDALWLDIEWVHPSHKDECVRLPDLFPPDNWADYVPRLQTVGDWLDLVQKVETAVRKRGEVIAATSQVGVPPSDTESPEQPVQHIADGVGQLEASNRQPLEEAVDVPKAPSTGTELPPAVEAQQTQGTGDASAADPATLSAGDDAGAGTTPQEQ